MEPVRSEAILIVEVGEHRLTVKIDPLTRASVRQPIKLAIDMNKIHLFDKETEKAIQ
ncbi:MAG: hypothetical protein V3W43_14955 [Desulfatiglandaceae bacterium]